ncbi:MAG: RluA family pseudouridine synthase [Clostridia bacterium]|nr:RluA family pseudouridine synthase [Clostridia bacterium]
MEIRIDKRMAGRTVKELLRSEVRLSGAMTRHLKFSEGGILVNGAHATVRYVLSEGDLVFLAVEDREDQEQLLPVSLPLEILYEDDDAVVPAKPADMPTHPSHGHHDDTVANALAYRYAELGVPFVFRPVNRLDRNTSGLLLVARNRIAAARLGQAMQRGEIRKTYLAILRGVPAESEGILETYMRRTAESVILRENCRADEGGALARTAYRVLAVSRGHSLVACEPLTGRTHQLRVHFAGLGCPILGDDLYGEPSPLIGRHALHSHRLTFPRPMDGETVTVESPLPDDMTAALCALGLPIAEKGEILERSAH